MSTKRELAEQVAAALGRPGDEATIQSYAKMPTADLQVQADNMPSVVARLKAEGHWAPEMPACSLCEEDADAEMGEFWDGTKQESVVAHAQCGLDAGLPLA